MRESATDADALVECWLRGNSYNKVHQIVQPDFADFSVRMLYPQRKILKSLFYKTKTQ